MCQPATGFANQCAVPLQDWISGKDSKKIKKIKKIKKSLIFNAITKIACVI